ncbi:carboxymuconolactone decarboxylase family protein [Nocardia sp. NPDC047654]|uniref:carboxymuconolactone decarboxylase family protein n=1 Tax=Nocardia sp. NPDC047654 TaxID=3364314 RepID=UPI0037175452
MGPDKDPAVDHGTIHATPGDWWTVFAQSPEVFRHAVRGFGVYRNATLDPALRELGQSRAGYARGSQFVFSQHCKQMRSLGVPEAKIAAIPHWQISDCFSVLERAVLAYITTLYDMHATICRALRLEYDDRPEPVEEVRLPEGVQARDLSADLSGTG